MPEMNQKLDRFTAAILAEATAEKSRTVSQMTRRRKETLAAAEDQILRESYNYIHDQVSRIKAEAGRRVSSRMLDNKRSVYLRRDQIAHEVFDAVREKIAVYTASEAYGRRLRELMVEASGRLSGAEDMRVYLRPGDMHYAADLSDAVPEVHLSFLEGEFQLGGLIVESPSLGLRCDSSFDSALEALEGHFAELFGLSLADEPEGGDQA